MNNIDKIFADDNDPQSFTKEYFSYLYTVLQNIDTLEVSQFIETILNARDRGVTVYIIGNGGSAATASHIANDFSIGTNDYEKPFRVTSLTDNVSVLSAIGNDFGYDEIFVRQLRVQAKKGDVLVGISASGNSMNIINAFDLAKKVGIKTVAITAFDGGKMRAMADEGIHVPTEDKEYGPAEDAHMILDHLVSGYLTRFIKHK
jgi:D-sedoheptulose 7-phosphate isomerase